MLYLSPIPGLLRPGLGAACAGGRDGGDLWRHTGLTVFLAVLTAVLSVFLALAAPVGVLDLGTTWAAAAQGVPLCLKQRRGQKRLLLLSSDGLLGLDGRVRGFSGWIETFPKWNTGHNLSLHF